MLSSWPGGGICGPIQWKRLYCLEWSKRVLCNTRDAVAAAELVGEETIVESDAPKNTVLTQDPAAGTMVDEGSSVDYVLSTGPALVAVPEVKDLSEADVTGLKESIKADPHGLGGQG